MFLSFSFYSPLVPSPVLEVQISLVEAAGLSFLAAVSESRGEAYPTPSLRSN